MASEYMHIYIYYMSRQVALSEKVKQTLAHTTTTTGHTKHSTRYHHRIVVVARCPLS